MRILFVHDHKFYYKNGIAYSNQFTESTWEPYTLNGNDVMVFARKTNKKCSQSSMAKGVFFCLTESYTKPISILYKYNTIFKELKSLVLQCDCVIARFPGVLSIIAASIAVKYKKKVMAEVVGNAYEAYRHYGNIQGWLMAPVYQFLNKKAIRNTNAAIYVTKKYLQVKYPTKGQSCACSDVLIEPVCEDVLQKRLSKIDKEKDHFVCGGIGNISVAYKGYEVMLKAMCLLQKENIIVDYHIAGGGIPDTFYALAEKYGVRKQVYYEGMIDHSKINQFYDKLDVYVHPSFLEGLPRVVVEAISRGCPCATSDVGGTPELVGIEFIHKSGDAVKLARDIKRFYLNKEIMKVVAKENFERAKSYYSDQLKPLRIDFYNQFYHL